MKTLKTPEIDQQANHTSEAPKSKTKWIKTKYGNLIRNESSGTYFFRVRVAGRLIRRTLKTDKITVARDRLPDFIKRERRIAENKDAVAKGTMKFSDALKEYRERLQGDASLKPRSKDYYEERIRALLKSWPELEQMDVRKISKQDCLKWAARYHKPASPSNYNHTIAELKHIMQIAVEEGLLHENPADRIPRKRDYLKPLELPNREKFYAIVDTMMNARGRFSSDCADLVLFLAYGGFRRGEAAHIKWEDCNFEKETILVRGNPETGTKNGSFRYVPMLPKMRALLTGLKKKRGEEPASAPVMKVKECYKALERACKKVGIAKITHHDLRHMFATVCNEYHVDPYTFSKWMGHKDGGNLATRIYTHLQDDHSHEMAKRVLFEGPVEQPNVISLTQTEKSQEPATQAIRLIQSGNLQDAAELLRKAVEAKEAQIPNVFSDRS